MLGKVAIRLVSWWRAPVLLLLLAVSPSSAVTGVRFADVIIVHGSDLVALRGWPIDGLGVVACDASACLPIPMQIDERAPDGAWVLDRGPQPSADEPPEIFDDDDVLLFMASDAGDAVEPSRLPSSLPVLEVGVTDPLTGAQSWVYVVGYADKAPRAAQSYVAYDAATDRFTGANVAMGFSDGVPTYLSIDSSGENLLDRLKVRVAASVFFGWLRFSRSEGDLTTELIGWHAGPIRVVRHQKQRVRLGWGIRSPTFRSYTYFYRDFAELPVGLRLNFPPTYFFSDIVIEVVLDFRNLDGWQLDLPNRHERVRIGDVGDEAAALNRITETSFALVGPRVTFVQTFAVSPSLEPVYKHFIYRDDPRPDPPEAVVGQKPGIGYGLERWEQVEAGEHRLTAISYAVPSDVDVSQFMRSRSAPLRAVVESKRVD